MALTADQIKVIQDFVSATQASNPNNWVDLVTQRMDEVGVSPAMLQEAYPALSVAQIQQAYDASRPQGMFSTNFVGPVASSQTVTSTGTQTSPAITLTDAARTNVEAPASTAPVDPGLLNATVQNQPRSGEPTGSIDPDKVSFIEQQLKEQYNALNQYSGYEYQGKKSDLDRFFKAQASKLAANGIGDLADVAEQDGKLINKVTGDPIKKITFSGNTWLEPNSTDFKVGEDIEIETAEAGFQRWGKDTSVDGQADYGINFVDGQAVMVPVWKDTKSEELGFLAAAAAVGLNFAFPGIGAAIGGALAPGASAAVQAAVGSAAMAGVTTGVITGDMDKALIAAALAGGGSYLNATGTLGEAFDSLGLSDFKDTFGIQGGVPTANSALLAEDAAFIAADASQLAAQGLSPEQISQTLLSTGANPDIARLAANLATTGSDATSIANTISGMGGGISGGLFSATPADLTAGGITIGGTGVPLSADQLNYLASTAAPGITLAEQMVGLGDPFAGLTTAAGQEALASTATGGGLLQGIADKASLNTLAEQAKGLLSGTNLTNLLGAGIDYAALQQIGKEATALGREAEARATAAGAAANVPFTPYTVTSGAGSTAFGVDPLTGKPTATVTAAQPYADLRTQALGLASDAYSAINPAQAAEDLYQRSEALAGPARQRETEQLLSTLGARGLLGISRNLPTVGGITGVTPGAEGVTGLTPGAGGITGVNPYLESLLSAQRTAQANTALQATQFGTQEAQRQAALAQGLISTGQGIDTAAMGTLTQGANLGNLATTAAQTSAANQLRATLAGQALRQQYEDIGLQARSQGLLGAAGAGRGLLGLPTQAGNTSSTNYAQQLFNYIFQ